MKEIKQLAQEFFEAANEVSQKTALRYFDKITNTWREISWQEYALRVKKVSGWLKEQGINPGDRVAILSANRPEWLIADLAILATGAISVPIYATSSEKDIAYILEHSEAKAIFIDSQNRIVGKNLPTLPSICVSFDPDPQSQTFDAILSSKTPPLSTPHPVAATDIATIIYTSGTTGVPKGVIHTHGTLMAAKNPVQTVLSEGKQGPDRFFSFLPLSHVAERVLVELGSILTRSEVTFARSVDTLIEDLTLYPPTILLCVPRLWEKIHERIRKGLITASPIKKLVFRSAEWLGRSRITDSGKRILKANDQEWGAKVADTLVGKQLKRKLGMHEIRMFLTGSAPTRPEILRFFGGFGVFIREVYGLTENLCLGAYTPPDMILIGSSGKAFPGGEVKIAADGEILLKAPWNFVGYYKNESATKEAFSEDGWLKTGDLGKIDAHEKVSITGRKKELLKTSTGKYVAPVPLEDELKQISLITDALLVGEGEKYCVALIALDATSPDIQRSEEILKDHLQKVNEGKAHHETIARLGILKTGFSIENGTLTPSLKLKRKAALEQSKAFIKKVYASSEVIVKEV